MAEFQSSTGLRTDYVRNNRESGAGGAWNTSAMAVARNWPPERTHLAILDDDDSWKPSHLRCVDDTLRRTAADLVATTHEMWKDGDFRQIMHPPSRFNQRDFLTRNPGVTGAFLVIRLADLMRAGMFDESLPSCTDRDLCIRLAQLPHLTYCAMDACTAIHYIDTERSQLSSFRGELRRTGLARFLAKHSPIMSADEVAEFFEQAEKRFGFSRSDLTAITRDQRVCQAPDTVRAAADHTDSCHHRSASAPVDAHPNLSQRAVQLNAETLSPRSTLPMATESEQENLESRNVRPNSKHSLVESPDGENRKSREQE